MAALPDRQTADVMRSVSPSATAAGVARMRRRVRGAVVAALLVSGMATLGWRQWRATPLPTGLTPEAYEAGAQRYRALYGRAPDPLDVYSLLGEQWALRDENLPLAAACFRAIPSGDKRYGKSARLQEAQVLARLNRVAEAERSFRTFLSLAAADPPPDRQLIAAYKWLTYLLSVELRFEERKLLLADLHARGLADVFDSKQLYFPHLLIWHSSSARDPLASYLQHDPWNLDLRIAHGRYLTLEGRLDEAATELEALSRQYPEDRRVAAALLECEFERNDWVRFGAVMHAVGSAAENEPWLLSRMRGQWALREGRWDDAVRHFERGLTTDAADPVCHVGLARAYGELRRGPDRERVLQRSQMLAVIRADLARVTEADTEASRTLAAQCAQIGLDDAAQAFRVHADRIGANLRRGPPGAGAPP